MPHYIVHVWHSMCDERGSGAVICDVHGGKGDACVCVCVCACVCVCVCVSSLDNPPLVFPEACHMWPIWPYVACLRNFMRMNVQAPA